MSRSFFQQAVAGAALAATVALVQAQEARAPKRAFNLPPSADLHYSIKARHKGFALSGEAIISWRVSDDKYTVSTDMRSSLLGKILENRSEGTIDSYGVAPAQFYEKRVRKDGWTTRFERDSKTISFTESKLSYPIKGGEQDRGTAPWQLVAVARAAPEKFTPGSEWTFFVAGRRDAEPWIFKVVNRETVGTGFGPVAAVHLVKSSPAHSHEQTLDIWLAPSHEWYPVRLRFTDNDGEVIEQMLDKIVKK